MRLYAGMSGPFIEDTVRERHRVLAERQRAGVDSAGKTDTESQGKVSNLSGETLIPHDVEAFVKDFRRR